MSAFCRILIYLGCLGSLVLAGASIMTPPEPGEGLFDAFHFYERNVFALHVTALVLMFGGFLGHVIFAKRSSGGLLFIIAIPAILSGVGIWMEMNQG